MPFSTCSSTASSPEPVQIHRYPRDWCTDAVRWLPTQSSAANRHIAIASFDAVRSKPFLQTQIYHSNSEKGPYFEDQAFLSGPSRITSLKTCPNPLDPTKPIIAASNKSGSVIFCTADLVKGKLNYEFSVRGEEGVLAIDLNENALECVSVGAGTRINLVKFEEKGSCKRVFEADENYSCVKWSSPMEFVTGGNRKFGMHWWDQREPGGPVAKLKGNWDKEETYGSVLSMDIHPSANHTCIAGCTSGIVFAWDIRSSKEPVMLGGLGLGRDVSFNWIISSDILEIQYDNYTKSASEILPAMACSEEGILGVIDQSRRPKELLSASCAIKSFDIDNENPSDVICRLESEDLVMLTRPNTESNGGKELCSF